MTEWQRSAGKEMNTGRRQIRVALALACVAGVVGTAVFWTASEHSPRARPSGPAPRGSPTRPAPAIQSRSPAAEEPSDTKRPGGLPSPSGASRTSPAKATDPPGEPEASGSLAVPPPDDRRDPPAAGPPPRPLDPETRAAAAELADEILKGAPNLELTGRAQTLLKELTGKQQEIVRILLEEYRKPHGRFVVRNKVIIKALHHLGSPEAKAALLHLAVADDPRTSVVEADAAKAVVALSNETSEILRLLDGAEEAVVCIGIRALKGRSLNRDATNALARQLKSESLIRHALVATAFGTDRSQETAGEKVDALLEASARVESLPGWERPAPQSRWTKWEEATISYLYAMSKMPGADGILRTRFAAARGRQRELALMALATRGYGDVHDELVGMIRSTTSGCLRAMAVDSLAKIGTDKDVPLLEELLRSDPFLRPDRAHPYLQGSIRDYPVRHRAKSALRKLQSQKKP